MLVLAARQGVRDRVGGPLAQNPDPAGVHAPALQDRLYRDRAALGQDLVGILRHRPLHVTDHGHARMRVGEHAGRDAGDLVDPLGRHPVGPVLESAGAGQGHQE